MARRKIHLTANTAGVDASWWTKRMAVSNSVMYQLFPEGVYAVGDGSLDLSFLTLPNLLLAAGPKNSRPEVIQWLTEDGLTEEQSKRRYLARGNITDGFYEIERQAISLAISDGIDPRNVTGYVDRDGVIIAKRNYQRGHEFVKHIRNTGLGTPLLHILTGSSMLQNMGTPFMESHGLTNENLGHNKRIQSNPYLMACENGAIVVNVLDHSDYRNVAMQVDPETTGLLTGPFRQKLYELMEQRIMEMLQVHWLPDTIEDGYMRQHEQKRGIWRSIDKMTMTTVNVPQGLRDNQEGKVYRQVVLECMQDAAEHVGLEYIL